MKKSETIAELAKALSQFQSQVKQPLKDKENPFYKSKYVPLENVVESITQEASKQGLSFIQFPLNEDNRVGVVTVIMHTSGEWLETPPIFSRLTKDDVQGVGAVITYLKRYSLSAVFGITSDEDDDGNSQIVEGGATNKQQAPKTYNNNIPSPKNAKEAASITLPFGQYKGMSLKEIYAEDPRYLGWLSQQQNTDKSIVKGIELMQQAIAEQEAKKKMEQGA